MDQPDRLHEVFADHIVTLEGGVIETFSRQSASSQRRHVAHTWLGLAPNRKGEVTRLEIGSKDLEGRDPKRDRIDFDAGQRAWVDALVAAAVAGGARETH
jgi:hypothetical protein